MIDTILKLISSWAIPVIILVIPVYGFFKRIPVYETFVEGAKEGFNVAVRIIPYLVAMLVAIGIFRVSGAMNILASWLAPITNLIGMPPETVPLALLRPLSGSGSLGLVSDLLKTYGPDSFIGKLASTMMGCTETTFYILAVYYGSVAVRKARHTVLACVIGDIIGVLASVFICRLIFRG